MKNNIAQKNIPQGWTLKRLSDILDYERPDNYIVKSTSYADDRKMPVLTANKSFILGYTDEDFGIYKNLPCVIFDDFTTDSKFVDFPFKVKSSAIKILKCKDKNTDLKFVHERMKLIDFPMGNHKRYYISQYQNLEILLPKLKTEQQKIAEILGTVDEDIAKTQGVIEAAEKLKKGLMQQLFTRGIGHTKFKKTKLGEIPEEWEVVKLEEIAQVDRGKFSHRPRNDARFYGGDISFIQTGDVISSNGRITKHSQTLNERGLKVSRMFKKGTIVLTIAANIGDTGILEFDSCFPDSLVGITPNNQVNNIFLEYFLRTRKDYLNKIATQSAQKNINLEKLRPLLVIKPKKNEQDKIAEILSAVDEKILINKKLKNKLTLLKKSLMQDILSGKTRINNN